jgi:3-oxoacyl-[acyl-carrier protein] reductase
VTNNKTLLVTGASKGIGLELVQHFVDAGWFVYSCSRSSSSFQSKQNVHFQLDVADESKVIKMFDEIRNRSESLYGLINNAGIASMNHFLTTPYSTVKKIMETNYFGTFLMMREAARLMRNEGGRIINFSSIAAPLNLAGEAAYAASKAAVESVTRVAARELSDFNITVNAIGPTPILTDLIRSVPDEKMKRLLSQQAINRLGTFEDVINSVEFLLSPKSAFITGQVVYLGGV